MHRPSAGSWRKGATMRLATMMMSGALIVGVAFAEPPARVALTNARIIPVVGDEIDKGTILIDHGKIAGVGTKVDVPYDAMEVDLAGKVVLPGLIHAHAWEGLDVPNENVDVGAYLDAYDAIDPSRLFFENCLRDGVTSVHIIQANNCVIGGLSRVVKPIGLDVDEMTVKPRAALKLSVTPKGGYDRMVQMSILRETFLELKDYLERLSEQKYEEDLKKQGKDMDVGPGEARKRGKDLVRAEDYDDAHAQLVALTTGKLDAWIYAGAATDVAAAVKIAKDNGFFDRSALILGPDTFKAIDELKAAGRPVVLDPTLEFRERDVLTGKLKTTFVPKVIADAGLTWALLPSPDSSLAERYQTYQAARCVREGVPRQKALEAITLNPAKMLGLGDKLGSIENGKIANLVVYSGDPLDFNSWVDLVYIDGVQAYDRKKDVRIRRLFEAPGAEERPKDTTAEKKAEDKKPAEAETKAAAQPPTESAPPEEKKPDAPDEKKPDTPKDSKTDSKTRRGAARGGGRGND